MQKKLFFILILNAFVLYMCSNIVAQTTTFDIATFTPPEGWVKNEKEEVITYTVMDNAKTKFCMVILYPSTLSLGDVKKDFANEWKSIGGWW